MNSLREDPVYGTKLLIVLKNKIENRRLGEKFMYFWKKSFLARIRKNSRTLSHDLPENQNVHEEVIIKFGVVISKFFQKNVKLPSINLTVKSGCTQYSLVRFLYRRLRYNCVKKEWADSWWLQM